jgi:hypothetical protein
MAGMPAAECRAEGSLPTYVFIVDTSLSMIGQATGASNILDKVKGNIQGFFQYGGFVEGAHVVVATFDNGLRDIHEFTLNADADRRAVISYVDSIRAVGEQTHIYSSLREILTQTEALRSAGGKVSYYLYTDGHETEPGRTIKDTVGGFQAAKGPADWFYYVTLGVKLEDWERQALLDAPAMKLVEVDAQQKPPTIVETTLPLLNFGDITKGSTRSQVFRLGAGGGAPDLKLRFEIKPEGQTQTLLSRGAQVSIEPMETAYADNVSLKLATANSDLIPPGAYTLQCQVIPSSPDYIMSPDTFDVSFTNGDASYNLVTELLDPRPDEKQQGAAALDVVVADKTWATGFDAKYKLVLAPSALVTTNSSAFPVPLVTAEAITPGAPPNLVSVLGGTGHVPFEDHQAVLDVNVPRGTKPGKYQARIVIYSPDAEVKGPGVKAINDGNYELGLVVDVVPEPLPLWMLALIGAGGLLVLGLLAVIVISIIQRKSVGTLLTEWGAALGWVKIRIENLSLYCMEPRESRGTQEFLDLSQETVGAGTEVFPSMPMSLRLRSVLVSGRKALQVSTDDGTFGVKRPGEKLAMPYSDTYVWSDDVIQVGQFRVRVDSNDLVGGSLENE